jgi:hypothetical protein
MTQEKTAVRDNRGDTRPQQQDTADRSAPRTPNERDASADSQSSDQGGNQAQNQAAARDAASGRPDTDKGPEMDRVYNDEVRDGTPKSGTGR